MNPAPSVIDTRALPASVDWIDRPIIEAHNLTKVYRLGEHQSLRGTLTALAGRRRERPTMRALNDVSFSIRRGECFGIVGVNGSGKSTLLQLLSQITLPTAGHAIVRGRVLPLLAVGTGFHPELTGRENVVLFGTVLGFRRRAILDRIDEIVDFAEIGSHIDTPLKRGCRLPSR
jgi:lipopolysaccharide transport system ATP-binding protein